MNNVYIHDINFDWQNIKRFSLKYNITSSLLFLLFIIHLIVPQSYVYILSYENNIIWREIISTFIHGNISHLLCNLISVYSLHNIEHCEGSKTYFYKTCYFIIMNALITEFLTKFFDISFSVGYSGVLFGFITLYPADNIFGLITFDKLYYPFIWLYVVQIIFDKAHFIGHLIGIMSAYLYIGTKNLNFRARNKNNSNSYLS
jgi:membrane associated rhomboid family serine protease